MSFHYCLILLCCLVNISGTKISKDNAPLSAVVEYETQQKSQYRKMGDETTKSPFMEAEHEVHKKSGYLNPLEFDLITPKKAPYSAVEYEASHKSRYSNVGHIFQDITTTFGSNRSLPENVKNNKTLFKTHSRRVMYDSNKKNLLPQRRIVEYVPDLMMHSTDGPMTGMAPSQLKQEFDAYDWRIPVRRDLMDEGIEVQIDDLDWTSTWYLPTTTKPSSTTTPIPSTTKTTTTESSSTTTTLSTTTATTITVLTSTSTPGPSTTSTTTKPSSTTTSTLATTTTTTSTMPSTQATSSKSPEAIEIIPTQIRYEVVTKNKVIPPVEKLADDNPEENTEDPDKTTPHLNTAEDVAPSEEPEIYVPPPTEAVLVLDDRDKKTEKPAPDKHRESQSNYPNRLIYPPHNPGIPPPSTPEFLYSEENVENAEEQFEAEDTEHTFVALLDVVFTDGSKKSCTGAIVHDNVVVTAAHCFTVNNNEYIQPELTMSFVVIGSKVMFDTGYEQYLPIERVVTHPRYRGWTADLALVLTFAGMTTEKPGKVIKLLGSPTSAVDSNVTVYSWGRCKDDIDEEELPPKQAARNVEKEREVVKPHAVTRMYQSNEEERNSEGRSYNRERARASDEFEENIAFAKASEAREKQIMLHKKKNRMAVTNSAGSYLRMDYKEQPMISRTVRRRRRRTTKKRSFYPSSDEKKRYKLTANNDKESDLLPFRSRTFSKNYPPLIQYRRFNLGTFGNIRNWRRALGPTQNNLTVESFGFVNVQTCSKLVERSMPPLYRITNKNEVICFASEDHYITNEDAGAPVVQQGKLVGITVGGTVCDGDRVAIAMKIACFCQWISENLPKSNFEPLNCCEDCCDIHKKIYGKSTEGSKPAGRIRKKPIKRERPKGPEEEEEDYDMAGSNNANNARSGGKGGEDGDYWPAADHHLVADDRPAEAVLAFNGRVRGGLHKPNQQDNLQFVRDLSMVRP